MSDEVAELIAEARKRAQELCEESGPDEVSVGDPVLDADAQQLVDLADALEQMGTTLEYDATYMKNLEAERDAAYAELADRKVHEGQLVDSVNEIADERDAAYAVIEQAVKYAKYDFGTGIQGLLAIAATVPADALREVKAQVWSEGFRVGRGADHNSDWWPKNPYREGANHG